MQLHMPCFPGIIVNMHLQLASHWELFMLFRDGQTLFPMIFKRHLGIRLHRFIRAGRFSQQTAGTGRFCGRCFFSLCAFLLMILKIDIPDPLSLHVCKEQGIPPHKQQRFFANLNPKNPERKSTPKAKSQKEKSKESQKSKERRIRDLF